MLEDRWFSVDEITAYLGIERETVYKWIAEKRVPAHRVPAHRMPAHWMPAHRMGRLWKFRKEEVDEWVRSGGADDARDRGDE